LRQSGLDGVACFSAGGVEYQARLARVDADVDVKRSQVRRIELQLGGLKILLDHHHDPIAEV
jgi:hypothetical protein